MKASEKSPVVKDMIAQLRDASIKNKAPVWKAVAKGLERPRRKMYEVSLSRIEKTARDTEIVVVPGKVLGSGDIKKKLTVAALAFSASALEKIEKSGGKCTYILDLVKENPKGSKVRIVG